MVIVLAIGCTPQETFHLPVAIVAETDRSVVDPYIAAICSGIFNEQDCRQRV